MTRLKPGSRNEVRWWTWGALAVFVLGLAIVAGLLHVKRAPIAEPVAEKVSPSPDIRADGNADSAPLHSNPAAPEPGVERPAPQAPNAPPVAREPAPAPTRDRAWRERLELALGRDPDLGAAEVQRRTLELQPPEDELLAMESPDLVDELALSPLQVAIFHSNDNRFDAQRASFARAHMGVDILLARPDAASALLNTYRSYIDLLADPASSGEASADLLSPTLELLLGADEVLEQFEAQDQLPALIESVLLSVEQKEQFNAELAEPYFGESMLNYAATVVGRSLSRLEDPNFQAWLAEPQREGLFTERPPSSQEAREILDMAATAYGPELAAAPGSTSGD